MEKLNIAEILKDCPRGMELDCTAFEGVKFDGIIHGSLYPIEIVTKGNWTEHLTAYGCIRYGDNAKCVIFPKGKTTWEGFVPPCKFKGDDIVVTKTSSNLIFYSICKGVENGEVLTYVNYYLSGNLLFNDTLSLLCPIDEIVEQRLATEEEKAKLFDVINAKGYKWNTETKTLESLAEPRFKVGDRIKVIINNYQYVIKELTDTHYTLEEVNYKFKYRELISEDKNWELVPDIKPKFKVGDKIKKKDGIDSRLRTIESINNNYYVIKTPDWFDNCYITERLPFNCQDEYKLVHSNKFDITTLKPFDKVLVRCNSLEKWHIQFFEKYNTESSAKYPFVCLCNSKYCQCIPYENNQHLLDTANDCNDFYNTWE